MEGCEPPHRLLVLTKDADEPDEGAIDATLSADGDQTILAIEEPVPADLLAEYGAGIQVHVEDLARISLDVSRATRRHGGTS